MINTAYDIRFEVTKNGSALVFAKCLRKRMGKYKWEQVGDKTFKEIEGILNVPRRKVLV